VACAGPDPTAGPLRRRAHPGVPGVSGRGARIAGWPRARAAG